MTLPLVSRLLLPLRLARARGRGSFVPESSVQPLLVPAADPRFDAGDSAYNGLGRTADGSIVFAVGSKRLDTAARLFVAAPDLSAISGLADLATAFPAGAGPAIPQGKVHVDLQTVHGTLYGASHAGHYVIRGGLERPHSVRGVGPYPGGWFFALEDARKLHALAQAPPGEGIITMTADAPRERLFALTWPSGLLLLLDLAACRAGSRFALQSFGPVLGSAENGSKRKGTWSRVCRSLGVDDDGAVYWCDDAGTIFRLDGQHRRPVSRMPRPEMWRRVVWCAEDRCFYGIAWNSASLFRFIPRTGTCEEIGSLRFPGTASAATLAFLFDGARRAIHALIPGPALLRRSQPQLAATVIHARFDLDTSATSFSAPLQTSHGRWVTQAQSLLLENDALYATVWVELPHHDQSARANHIRRLRRDSPEYRSRGYAEEMRLVRVSIVPAG